MKLVECPRDALQGWKKIIPTNLKVEYINSLLQVGFDTIDFGSFVSPKAIPQMADIRDVLKGLRPENSSTKLLAIVANLRGAQEAADYETISCLGFPFSLSETFQQRNTNSSVAGSFHRVEEIQELCQNKGKELVIYISMGFGNPYGDPYSEEIVFEWVEKMANLGVKIISLADTVGLATPEQVETVTRYVINLQPEVETGVHLHSTPYNWKEKMEAALKAGCRRFDGALKGIGGCPMAGDDLVGNMNTEWMISLLKEKNIPLQLNEAALKKSSALAAELFS